MDNLGYLFAAFAVAWALIFAYVLSVGRRLGQLETRVRDQQDGDPS